MSASLMQTCEDSTKLCLTIALCQCSATASLQIACPFRHCSDENPGLVCASKSILPSLTCPMCSQVRARDEGVARMEEERIFFLWPKPPCFNEQLRGHGSAATTRPPLPDIHSPTQPCLFPSNYICCSPVWWLHCIFWLEGTLWTRGCYLVGLRILKISPLLDPDDLQTPLSDNHSYILLSDPSTTPPPAPSG